MIQLPEVVSQNYGTFFNHLGVLFQLWRLWRLYRFLVNTWTTRSLAGIVLIDYGAIHLQLIKRLKKRNPDLQVVYISPPKTWASRAGRLKQLKRYVDVVVVVYAFEADYFKKQGIPCVHLKGIHSGTPMRHPSTISSIMPILCYPGSRRSEIVRHVPLAISAVKQLRAQGYPAKLWVSKVPQYSHYNSYYPKTDYVSYFQGELCPMYANMVAWVCSGTMAGQVATFGVPMLVMYDLSSFAHFVFRSLVRYKGFISLPNIQFSKEVYPELVGPVLSVSSVVRTHLFLWQTQQKKPTYYHRCSQDWVDVWNSGLSWHEGTKRIFGELSCQSSH